MSAARLVVSNAGPLMVLAKLNLLHLLRILYGRVHFSASVYDEVVTQGLQRGYQDAETLELFMQQTQWSADLWSCAPIQSRANFRREI